MNRHNRDEIISEGNLAVLNCAMKYRPEFGAFSTYLVRSVFNGLTKVNLASQATRDAMMHRERIKEFDAIDHRDVGLPDLDRPALLRKANNAMRRIDARWRKAVRWHVKGMTYEEMAGRLNVTRSRAAQIVNRAVEELRKHCGVAG